MKRSDLYNLSGTLMPIPEPDKIILSEDQARIMLKEITHEMYQEDNGYKEEGKILNDDLVNMDIISLRNIKIVNPLPIPSIKFTNQSGVCNFSYEYAIKGQTVYVYCTCDVLLSTDNTRHTISVSFCKFGYGKDGGLSTVKQKISDSILHIFADYQVSLITQYGIYQWVYIQKKLINRPDVFNETRRIISSRNMNEQNKREANEFGKNRIHKVKVQRVISCNFESKGPCNSDSELPHRKITCPEWNVIGHFRHYKNGKTIWIAPYKKGTNRGRIHDDYRKKEYVLSDLN